MLCTSRNQQKLLVLSLLFIFFALYVLFKWPFSFRVYSKSENCLVYSPGYPSAGGPGCSSRCVKNEGRKTSMYGAAFYNHDRSWPGELGDNMELAASILRNFGEPRTLSKHRGQHPFHLTFDYYCCYTEEEAVKIGKFLKGYSWTPHEVWFDKMECAIHGYGDLVSFVLMVDEKSQQELTRWVLKNERDLEVTTGLKKHIPHTQLQDFHITLATVNQSSFPVQSAVEEINRVIPPGKWHKSPVFLQRPICERCEKVMETNTQR